MNKYIIASLLILLSAMPLMSQETSTLMVQGGSLLSVAPTQTTITFTIQSKSESYAGAVNDMVGRVDQLVEILKALKFKTEELTTSNFSIDKDRRYEQGLWKELGFIATQNVVINFPLDKKRLVEVLSKTTSSKSAPEIAIAFTLDEERKIALKNELIKLAVKDAQSKAEIISETAGYKVTGIKSIEYGQGGGQPRPLMAYAKADTRMMESSLDVQMTNFEAADLTFSDGVQIIYQISSLEK